MKIDSGQVTAMAAAVPGNVKRERAVTGLSQPRVAEGMRALGCWWYPETVSQVEHGARQLKVKELLALSAVLGCGTDVLLFGRGGQ
jgi:transcriptional regulator with XRE-family HTH domain